MHTIKESSSILIVGGGTGKILESFSASHTIDYVEPSASMINRSKQRSYQCDVQFHPCSIQEFIPSKDYDVIVLPFVLDLFNSQELEEVIRKCTQALNHHGRIHISDFYPEELLDARWKKLLLRTVIVFFRITTKHHLQIIVNITPIMQATDYKKVTSKNYFHGMVFASLWERVTH